MHHQRQDPHEISNTVRVQAINLCPTCRSLQAFKILGYCSTHARGISASRDRDKNMGELLRDSIVVSTLLKLSCSRFITRKKTSSRIFRHMRLTLLPSIFIRGVHPPSPHPKSPIWQRTVIGLDSRSSGTSWLAFDPLGTRKSILDHIIRGGKFLKKLWCCVGGRV